MASAIIPRPLRREKVHFRDPIPYKKYYLEAFPSGTDWSPIDHHQATDLEATFTELEV